MTDIKKLREFYRGRKVLVTGHTGFKGSTLTAVLSDLGAEVLGYSLPAPTEPSLFELMYGFGASCRTRRDLFMKESPDIRVAESFIADIRNFDALKGFVMRTEPDVIIHMAAQPIVRESYRIPRETYETNVMGAVNILEVLRLIGTKKEISFLNVTTDKVYLNVGRPGHAYAEDDKLDGRDPYSNSKSCSELVTHSYASSFFEERKNIRISTARAGNVIGGGDFAKSRIMPDCMRAYLKGESVRVRNPYSTRPYQHVLEPLLLYLTIAMEQAEDERKAGYYNVGPDIEDCIATGELCGLLSKYLSGFSWKDESEEGAVHEASYLELDNSRIKKVFGWRPKWHIADAVSACAAWTESYARGIPEANRELIRQIGEYLGSPAY